MGRNINWWLRRSWAAASQPTLLLRRLSHNCERFIVDYLSLFGYYKYPYHIIFLAGMALGGTTWMKNLLARIPGYSTRRTPMPREVAIHQNIIDSAFSCIPKHGYALFKTHLNPTQENLECILRNGVKKVLVTYRDFRDVLVSRYHRILNFPLPRGEFNFVDYESVKNTRAS